MAKAMYKVGSKVTVASGPNQGKSGKVRGYTDLAQDDIVHVIDLDEPMFVHHPNDPKFDPITGQQTKGHQVDWIEAPASTLSDGGAPHQADMK